MMQTDSVRKSSVLAAALVCVCLAGGCRFSVLGPADTGREIQFYDLQPERAESAPPAADGWADAVLLVETFSMADKYDDRMFRQLQGSAVTRLEFDRWILPPDRLLTAALMETFLSSHAFRLVVDSRSTLKPDLKLSGHVLCFEQGRDDAGNDAAILRMTAVLRRGADNDAVAGAEDRCAGTEIIWRTVITETEPMADDAPQAFVAAMSANVHRAVRRMHAEIVALRP